MECELREKFIFDSVIGAIPQWFESNQQTSLKYFTVGQNTWYFSSHRRLTPNLSLVLDFCQQQSQRWLENLPDILSSSTRKQITQEIALFWLQTHDRKINWPKFIAYAEELLFRTYENAAVSSNLIITSRASGNEDICEIAIQKFLDPLCTSMQTYFKVDAEVNLIGYEQINWSEINDTSDYKFSPEFLQPFASTIENDQFSLHVTIKGDILIMNSLGLLTSYRKGKWHIYDAQTLKNSIGDIAGDYRIGCNIFEVLLDLSYKRHGALLVYDPDHVVVEHIINNESLLLNNPDMGSARAMLAPSVAEIGMGNSSMLERKKRIMLELSSMDGAVIFDNSNILSFGAMIETNPSAGNHAGARTTAFESAFLYGGKPFKVSSDGDITLRFTNGCGRIDFL